MGMDVYGLKPKNSDGEYFRANVWYWHPLWGCLEHLYPNLTSKVEHAHENSGDGLNAKDSLTLSKLLKKDLDNNVIEQYITEYYSYINNLEKKDCTYCEGTGIRIWHQELADPISKTCNVCNGTLQVAPSQSWYHMDLNLMKQFQVFLENCGGFQIC